jgi:hypothetical protein
VSLISDRVKTSSNQSGGQAHGWGASPDPSIRKDWRVSCFSSQWNPRIAHPCEKA